MKLPPSPPKRLVVQSGQNRGTPGETSGSTAPGQTVCTGMAQSPGLGQKAQGWEQNNKARVLAEPHAVSVAGTPLGPHKPPPSLAVQGLR